MAWLGLLLTTLLVAFTTKECLLSQPGQLELLLPSRNLRPTAAPLLLPLVPVPVLLSPPVRPVSLLGTRRARARGTARSLPALTNMLAVMTAASQLPGHRACFPSQLTLAPPRSCYHFLYLLYFSVFVHFPSLLFLMFFRAPGFELGAAACAFLR